MRRQLDRTPEQDPAFGIQQLVDVAVKALSPGINDPTTACMCADQLGALLLRLSERCFPSSYRMHDGVLRVITPKPTYRSLVVLAFSAIVSHSRGDAQVLHCVLQQIEGRLARTRARRLGTSLRRPRTPNSSTGGAS